MARRLIGLPFRVGLGSARLALRSLEDVSAWGFELVGAALELVRRPGADANGGPPTEAPERERAEGAAPPSPPKLARRPPRPRPSRPESRRSPAPPARPEPEAREVTPPPRPEAAPPSPPEPEHTPDSDAELVLESSEAGAEDGAGAQIRIAEPWDGYDGLAAKNVIDRIATASPEEVAAVELYEGTRRARKSVLAAAERRLREESTANHRPGGQANG